MSITRRRFLEGVAVTRRNNAKGRDQKPYPPEH